jgi:hypothetical protein
VVAHAAELTPEVPPRAAVKQVATEIAGGTNGWVAFGKNFHLNAAGFDAFS